MCNTSPDHYSHRFRLKIDKLPAMATDRFSRPILFPALLLGLLLLGLGFSYFITDTNMPELRNSLPSDRVPLQTVFSPALFCGIISLVGFGIILSTFNALIRYKKIFFDGQTFVVTCRTLTGGKKTFEESLYNYAGVRLRVKFYQFGIFTKNKFIIELYHKDAQKIIPLYISTGSRSLRRRWKEYAQALKMPALRLSEKGMISFNAIDLDNSYKQIIEQWHLPKNFVAAWDKPSYISLHTRQTGEKMIKIGKVLLDAYNLISLFFIGIFTGLLVYAWLNFRIVLEHISLPLFTGISCFALATIIYSLLNLFATDIIIFARNKVVLFRKLVFFRIYKGIIHIQDIKGIDINHIPSLNRYYLAIISNQETLVFGEKMPVKDLRWIRAVLINEIIGN